jgi:hypothetical protein
MPSPLFPCDLKTLSLLDDKKAEALVEDYGLYDGSGGAEDVSFSRMDYLNKVVNHFQVTW